MVCTMVNPLTDEVVVTNEKFKERWEKLGFVEVGNVIPLSYAVTR